MTLLQILSMPIYGIQLSRGRFKLLINSQSPTLQFVMGNMEVDTHDKCRNVLPLRPSVIMDVNIYDERWGKYIKVSLIVLAVLRHNKD